MVREETNSSASRGTYIRKKSPARAKSPSRKGPASKSPESKPEETTKKTRERSSGRKTPERSKSPSRVVKDKSLNKITKEKSPSRPARTKSPGRTKSPSRLSPSRTAAGDTKVIIKKVSVQINKNEIELSGSDDDIPKEKPRATVKGRSRKFELEEILQPNVKYAVRTESYNATSNEVRRLTRSSQSQERLVHLKHFDTVPKKLGEFSDDENTSTKPVKKTKISLNELLEVLHFIILTPVFVIAMHLLCSESKCTLFALPEWKNFKSLNYFFNLHAFIGYSAVAGLMAVLSTLPFGGGKICSLPSKQPKFTYVINGLFSLVVMVSLAVILENFSDFKISTFIVEHLFHLMISSIIMGTLFSVYLYIRSFYVPISSLNSAQVDSSFLSGFFYGREVNPRLGNVLDFKIYLLRLYSLSLVLVDGALLVKGLELDTKLGPAIRNLDWKPLLSHPTLLVIVILHLIYFVGHLVYEARALSTYFIQYEAPGFATNIGILLLPFQMILQTKYIVDHKVEYANWELGVLCLVYLIGYIIFTVSNNQKDSFRRNPYSTSAKFESIPTSQGKRILCSGCWGVVRQPNIIGDILVHLVFLRFAFDAYPVFAVVSIIHMLVGRAINSQEDCKNKYGAAWDKYCEKVKYVLIPRVY